MHTHARTFMFAGATCLGLFGAAFAYTPTETANLLVQRDASMPLPVPLNARAAAIKVAEAGRIPLNETVWPTDVRHVASPYGPRLRDDGTVAFHAGIDIRGGLGSDVRAIADGEVFAVYGPQDAGNPYPNAGTVIVLRHVADRDVMHEGRPVRRYYTIYAHLDGSLLPSPADGTMLRITRGTRIGTIGHDERTDGDEPGTLHVEARIGSLAGAPLHPLLLLPYDDEETPAAEVLSTAPLTVRASTRATESDIAEIHLQTTGRVKKFPLATSSPEVTIAPSTNGTNDEYALTFTFPNVYDAKSVVVRDVWGKGIRLTP